MPKKKTRKQKELAQRRRAKQLEIISQKTNEEDSEQSLVKKASPTLSPTPAAELKFTSINTDLKKVTTLVAFFAILLAILVITENQYNYLSPLANNLMDFLIQR